MTTPHTPASAGPAGWSRAAQPGPSPAGAALGFAADLPDIVITPAHPASRDGQPDIVFELREGTGSAAVLPVFSTVQRLVQALGGAQPWVALPLQRLRELAERGGVHLVLLDPEVEPGAWRWQASDLERFEESSG